MIEQAKFKVGDHVKVVNDIDGTNERIGKTGDVINVFTTGDINNFPIEVAFGGESENFRLSDLILLTEMTDEGTTGDAPIVVTIAPNGRKVRVTVEVIE